MEIFDTPTTMRAWSHSASTAGATIAVVPTMGALHRGHLTLVEHARQHADKVIVSIFVNPLQFDQASDLDTYPRPIHHDVEACATAGVDAVYAPTASTMYPPAFQTHVEPGALAEVLEGPLRPGHFRGVTTVVAKLFGATRPDVACFGAKDFQQLAIITQMVTDLDLGIQIVSVPIVRDDDGLALSSRNALLTPAQRSAAVVLNQALEIAAAQFARGERDATRLESRVATHIGVEQLARLDDVSVVDARTLGPVTHIDTPVVLAVAAWFGETRLIDNRLLAPTSGEGL